MKIFVASSTIGLRVAEAIQLNLENYAGVTLWNQQVFGVADYQLESLELIAKDADYGIFVVTPDDILKIKGKTSPVARDNVIFEMGMFVGSVGRRCTFLVVPNDVSNLHLPSDLLGIVQARYKYDRLDENAPAALGAACTQIKQAIEKLERGKKVDSDNDLAPSTISPEANAKLQKGGAGSCLHYHGRLPPNYTGHFLRDAHSEICILGFSLRSFVGYFDSRPESEVRTPILEALNRGVRVCLLFLDPESAAARTFVKDRGDKDLRKEIHQTITLARELKTNLIGSRENTALELRTYSQVPFGHIKRVDGDADNGRILTFPYLLGVRRPDIPYLEVRKRSNPMVFAAYSKALDNILSKSSPVE
jgi:hypothetical protein